MAVNSSFDISIFHFDHSVIRQLFELSHDEQHKLGTVLATCDDSFRRLILDMIAIVENPRSTANDKARACAAIDEAIEAQYREGAPASSLRSRELSVVEGDPESNCAGRQTDSQEAAFACALRDLMKRKGVTQRDLAIRVGCTQPAISQMLNRQCRPQRQTILKLAEALDASPRQLWPDLEVADILDTVAAVQQDQDMTPEEADAYRHAMERTPTESAGKPLPKLRR